MAKRSKKSPEFKGELVVGGLVRSVASLTNAEVRSLHATSECFTAELVEAVSASGLEIERMVEAYGEPLALKAWLDIYALVHRSEFGEIWSPWVAAANTLIPLGVS